MSNGFIILFWTNINFSFNCNIVKNDNYNPNKQKLLKTSVIFTNAKIFLYSKRP